MFEAMLKSIKRRFNPCSSRSTRSGWSPAAAAAADLVAGQLSDFDSSSFSACSDEDVDDDDDDDVGDLEGPTIITVDDGKGGIRHVRVPKPPDTQSEAGFLVETFANDCSVSNLSSPVIGPSMQPSLLRQQQQPATAVRNQQQARVADATAAAAPATPVTPSIGELLRREFRGRHIFHLDSDTEKLRKRIVSKKGVVHIGRSHLERKQRRKYLSDFFNTMLDMKWRYMLLIFTLSFFMSWLAFACVWYFIMFIHGDLDADHLPDSQAESGWQPCVNAIHGFVSCFLFSIETQHTIGYGGRMTTERCPVAIFVMSFQSVVGVMIQACMVGTIFAKLSRPKHRAQTLLFSKNAVICRRDGHLCLCFRLGNMRSSHLVECHARAILVSKKVTEEGENIPYHQTELSVGTDLEGQEDTIFFIWPMTIVHRINEDSPFYNMSARDFLKKRYEIILVLEGIAEPTGMSIQARTSYLPNEILWGYRFVNVLNYKRRDGVYKIDYGSFNQLYKVDTPSGSARSQQQKATLAAAAAARRDPMDEECEEGDEEKEENHLGCNGGVALAQKDEEQQTPLKDRRKRTIALALLSSSTPPPTRSLRAAQSSSPSSTGGTSPTMALMQAKSLHTASLPCLPLQVRNNSSSSNSSCSVERRGNNNQRRKRTSPAVVETASSGGGDTTESHLRQNSTVPVFTSNTAFVP